MNILALIQLLKAISAKADPRQTISDVVLLYPVYEQGRAAKLDLPGMAKAGSLKPAVEAVARLSATIAAVMDDPAQAANVAALVGDLA